MEFVANFTLNNDSLDAEFDVSEVENFDALFEIYASGTTWGNISGDIENQTDLQNALSGLSDDIGDLQTTVTNNYNELSGNLGELETTVTNNYNELSGDIGDLSTTVTNNYNELNSSIDSNHQAISNINNTIQSYGDIVSYDAADFATSAQGALADTALQPNDNISELTNDIGYITSASLPVVNNNRITIQKNGSPVGDFTLNQASDEAININVPTTAAEVGALPDTTTINDLTTTAQQEALNSGANTTNIGQISANAQAIQTETTNRTNADNNLQSQIDAITAASDVTDIVGTYAELQGYDTTNLPNNSIIKVLQDESRDDETTYYRWVITGGVGAWVLIGEEGPYYTKSEADSTFVPQTRTVNGKALSSNIILDASDVGALPDSTVIPTVNNATLTIQKNGANVQTFTANASSDVTANITVPTDTSDLTNGAGFITAASLPTVNNGTLTIQANGTTVGTFTANQAGNTTANIVVPDSATWGNITGTLSNQTDLQNALNSKADSSSIGNGTVTFTQGGVTKGSITMNQSGNTTIALEQGGGGGDVTDVEVNGNSVVTDGVAEIDLTGYQEKLTAGTDLEIVEGSTGHELPEGYTECEYISNTADVVRDIALSGNNIDTKVTIYAKLDRTLSSSQVLLSFGQGTGNSWFGSPTNYNVWGNGTENANLSWSSSTIYSEITINIDYTSSNYATVSGEIYRPDTMSIRTFTRTGGTNSVGNFTLFGSNGSNHYYARASVYYAKFEQGGLVVSELIPARQESDSKYGLYDIVRDRFFTSSYFTGQEASFNPETVINFTNDSGYITSADLNGYATQTWVGQQGYLTSITSAQVTNALGYTPYNATNPNGYTSNVGTVTSVNNELPDANGNVTIQSGSSRNIGEIVTSTIPLTDAGLHLLDGALISGSGSYSAFVDYIAGLVTDYPDLFDTEANWQSAVTQYGICEKFVYDSTNNTVRLPKYGNQIYTGGTVPVLGNGMSVGLTTNTNNLGTLGISTNDATNRTYAYAHTPATLPATLNSPYLTNVNGTAVGITTDATKSGIISNPEDISMDCYYYIVVATSTKTDIQVDIDEIATDLNGKADTDFSNVTDVAKNAMANASMPSDTYEDLTLGASGTTYTAPADGWFTVRITSTGGTGIAYVTLNSSELLITRDSNYHPSTATNISLNCSIPVKKGSVVTINYSAMPTVSNKTLRFIYAEGSKSEAI